MEGGEQEKKKKEKERNLTSTFETISERKIEIVS